MNVVFVCGFAGIHGFHEACAEDLLFLYTLNCFELCYHLHVLLLLIESVEVTFAVN